MNTFYRAVKCIHIDTLAPFYHRFRHTNNEFSVALRALLLRLFNSHQCQPLLHSPFLSHSW